MPAIAKIHQLPFPERRFTFAGTCPRRHGRGFEIGCIRGTLGDAMAGRLKDGPDATETGAVASVATGTPCNLIPQRGQKTAAGSTPFLHRGQGLRSTVLVAGQSMLEA